METYAISMNEEAFFKMSIIFQLIKRFNAIQIKITIGFVVKFGKLILKSAEQQRAKYIQSTHKEEE